MSIKNIYNIYNWIFGKKQKKLSMEISTELFDVFVDEMEIMGMDDDTVVLFRIELESGRPSIKHTYADLNPNLMMFDFQILIIQMSEDDYSHLKGSYFDFDFRIEYKDEDGDIYEVVTQMLHYPAKKNEKFWGIK